MLLSDIHDIEYPSLGADVAALAPDIIAIPGDLTSRLDKLEGEYAETDKKTATHGSALALLSELAQLAPTYYSFGNHELCGHYYKKNFGLLPNGENLRLIRETGAVLLSDSFCRRGDIVVGGLSSGMTRPSLEPITDWLDEFEAQDGFRILLCHHPEYYEKYLRHRDIELVLSGHAHGGQIRIFGRGLFAPGQGVLPRYDGGFFDGRLAVGRGLANTAPFPRFFNSREIVVIDIDRKV